MVEWNDPAALDTHLAQDKRTVVFFEMTGCPYCVACKSRFADLVRERSADVRFVRVLLDDPGNPLWRKYDIHAVPTAIAFERGGIVARADSILFFGLPKKRWLDFLERL